MKKHVLHLSVSNLSIIFATEWHDICTFKHRWPISFEPNNPLITIKKNEYEL